LTRAWWLNPAVIIIAAFAGQGVCRAMHVDPHAPSMVRAAVVSILAAELALVPLAMTRGAPQATMVQSGLLATAVQLFCAAAMSGGVLWVLREGPPFVFWVLPFYWISLAVLVAEIIRAIRLAPALPAGAGKP